MIQTINRQACVEQYTGLSGVFLVFKVFIECVIYHTASLLCFGFLAMRYVGS